MFIGRERDLKDLEALWERDHGVLVTCRGRRRIGKSTLIEEFASRSADIFIRIEGLAPRKGMTDAAQRRRFCEKVAEYAERDMVPAATWALAFAQLDELLASGRRTVVLLDEISIPTSSSYSAVRCRHGLRRTSSTPQGLWEGIHLTSN